MAVVRNLGRETEEQEKEWDLLKVTQQFLPPLPSAWKMSTVAPNLRGP